jgi:hypothetical protein
VYMELMGQVNLGARADTPSGCQKCCKPMSCALGFLQFSCS